MTDVYVEALVTTAPDATFVAPSQSAIPRFDLLGVEVTAATVDSAIGQVREWIEHGDRSYVCVSDTNSLLQASADIRLRSVFNSSGMTLPDGMPLVWAGHHAGFDSMARVCGPDLMVYLLTEAAERGWSSYFYGGAEGVAEEMVAKFEQQIPGMKVAGVASPPFRVLTTDETAAAMDEINNSGADIVWVGLGAPKQERWMAEHRALLHAPVLLGVGAAFDMHAGRVSRAPRWMQRSGLEWCYRLVQEPRRLWRRYFVAIPTFIWGVLWRRPHPVQP